MYPHRQAVRDAVAEFLDVKVANAPIIGNPESDNFYVSLSVTFWAKGVRMMTTMIRIHPLSDEGRVARYDPASPCGPASPCRPVGLSIDRRNELTRRDVERGVERDTADIEEFEKAYWFYQCFRTDQQPSDARQHVRDMVARFMAADVRGETSLHFNSPMIIISRSPSNTMTTYTYCGLSRVCEEACREIDDVARRVEQDLPRLTIWGDRDVHRTLREEWVNVSGTIAAKTAGFWHDSKEEFIAKAWAPDRFVDWCLPHDEQREFAEL